MKMKRWNKLRWIVAAVPHDNNKVERTFKRIYLYILYIFFTNFKVIYTIC